MFSSLVRCSVRHAGLTSIATPLVSRLSLHHARPAARLATQSLGHRPFSTSFALKKRAYPEATSNHPIDEAVGSDPEHEMSSASNGRIPTRFQDLEDWGMMDSTIVRNITQGMKYDTMTKVQSRTIATTLAGGDVLAQAKTGTGKTIAFLLPTLQRILTAPGRDQLPRRRPVKALVISPTRELATQIYDDVQRLAQGANIKAQIAVGGSGKAESLRSLDRYGCDILIATPGRLHDILDNNPETLETDTLDTVVLDEADTLLDAGHGEKLREIFQCLPPKDAPVRGDESRQTLLFSATMPQKVLQIVRQTLKRDYKYLKMVEKGEVPTHQRVKQHFIRCKGIENHLPAIVELCKRELDARAPDINADSAEIVPERPFKAIIFFPTVHYTAYAAQTLLKLRKAGDGQRENKYLHPARIYEMHSGLSQSRRTNTAALFKEAKSAIMVASDVLARGMDFPDVTHVIQVGAPRNGEYYVHRVGRTARGDKEGVGYIFMSDAEHTPDVQHMLSGIPFVEDENPLQLANLDLSQEQTVPKSQAELLLSLSNTSLHHIEEEKKAEAYKSLVGYYSGNYKSKEAKQMFADALNRWPKVSWGMETPPAIKANLLMKLGYGSIEGFVQRKGRDEDEVSRDRSRNSRSSDRSYERRPYGHNEGRGGHRFNDRRETDRRGGQRYNNRRDDSHEPFWKQGRQGRERSRGSYL